MRLLQDSHILESIHRCDLVTFSWCLRRKHRSALIKLSRLISRSADGPLYALGALVLACYGNWQMVSLLGLAFAVERLVYFCSKRHFKRNRPPQAIPGFESVIKPSDQFSFPSGHTSAAFLTAGILSHAFPYLSPLLYPWAAAVGGSRVMLGVHFPSDIVAGALLGHTLSLLVLTLSV
ncbi:phosphatase PAP2 family protein [Exilibacterium tricleocarpae]|uniref:undecaprenyl-diphosphate phosphatase n=1 Tax=Exilibacterium tricleocarpae TaxID=2591008 RepID=A0A545T8F6_9GAMM|nr:phosphatase PAP2 family protein [Exilibacterium tricleocarpae]TQV73496.1 phosphatase PAP2 family protein [Exilibacterium tricleocarpae]